MSQVSTSHELQAQSEELLQGPLKHARTAALALALVPLAAVAVTTQVKRNSCPSGGICGTVFYDTNNDGVQDASEPGIPGVSVTIIYSRLTARHTSSLVRYQRFAACMTSVTAYPRSEYTISVQIPPDTTASPSGSGRRRAARQRRHARRSWQQRRARSTGPMTKRRIPAPTSASRQSAVYQSRNWDARILEESS